jgi:hypothetical protein
LLSRTRWVNLVAVAAFLLPVLAACAAPDTVTGFEDDVAPTLRAPATTTADPAEAARHAAIEAYRGMWAVYDQAGRPPAADPDNDQLGRYAAGEALLALVSGLTSMRDAGLVFDGNVVFSPVVMDLSHDTQPASARIEDCADSTEATRVRADGEPFDDEPGGRRLIIADLEEAGDGWKVVDFAVRGVGTCG